MKTEIIRLFKSPVRRQVEHVYPLGDLAPHTLDGVTCACLPRVEDLPSGISLVVHNSFVGARRSSSRLLRALSNLGRPAHSLSTERRGQASSWGAAGRLFIQAV